MRVSGHAWAVSALLAALVGGSLVVLVLRGAVEADGPPLRADAPPARSVGEPAARAFTDNSWWNTPLPRDAPSNPHAAAILDYLRTAPESGPGCLVLAGAGASRWGQPMYIARPGDRAYHV